MVNAGDFESVLSFGVGLARNAPFHMYAQPRLGRVILDVKAPYRTVPVRDYFLNTHRFATGQAPYAEAVYRPVTWPATVSGAMQRLFGSAFTIASEIMPTLKQFRSIRWVKIYDARGHTERPFGPSDSIPFSLEP